MCVCVCDFLCVVKKLKSEKVKDFKKLKKQADATAKVTIKQHAESVAAAAPRVSGSVDDDPFDNRFMIQTKHEIFNDSTDLARLAGAAFLRLNMALGTYMPRFFNNIIYKFYFNNLLLFIGTNTQTNALCIRYGIYVGFKEHIRICWAFFYIKTA